MSENLQRRSACGVASHAGRVGSGAIWVYTSGTKEIGPQRAFEFERALRIDPSLELSAAGVKTATRTGTALPDSTIFTGQYHLRRRLLMGSTILFDESHFAQVGFFPGGMTA